MEKNLEILELPPAMRELVGECELTGRRTHFIRNGRAVATLVSHDEYLALRETVEIANDVPLRAQIAAAEEELERGALVPGEDLTGKRSAEDRLRATESVERTWQLLPDDRRKAVVEALTVIEEDPIIGAPLFEPLRGLWCYRRDGIRIIYRILAEARFVLILAIA